MPAKRKRVAKTVSHVVAPDLPVGKTGRKSQMAMVKFLFIIIVILGLAYAAKGVFIAALVNGRPVWRLSVIQELEKRQGKSVLDTMETEMLIRQEADKQKVGVSRTEIDAEVAKIEERVKQQGQDFNQLLTAQGMTRADLAKQITFQKLLEKLLSDKISVTDGDIDDYMEKNKASFPKDTDPAALRDSVGQQLVQDKLSAAVQPWIADLKKNAKITTLISY